jgi:hypothetical protein
MRLYISGPMTGYPNHNFDAFNEAEKALVDAGFEVENPATKGVIDGWTWNQYLRYDLQKLVFCDGIALLPDWQNSRGARREVLVADAMEITSLALERWLARPVVL